MPTPPLCHFMCCAIKIHLSNNTTIPTHHQMIHSLCEIGFICFFTCGVSTPGADSFYRANRVDYKNSTSPRGLTLASLVVPEHVILACQCSCCAFTVVLPGCNTYAVVTSRLQAYATVLVVDTGHCWWCRNTRQCRLFKHQEHVTPEVSFLCYSRKPEVEQEHQKSQMQKLSN